MIKKVRTKNLKGLIEEHRKEKVIYRTYEFDNDSYFSLLCDINSLLHQLEEKEKVIDKLTRIIELIDLGTYETETEDLCDEAYEILERGKK